MSLTEKINDVVVSYSVECSDGIAVAPYIMNGAPCRPSGDYLNLSGGSKQINGKAEVGFQRDQETAPNHIGIVQEIQKRGTLIIAHSGRSSWDSDLGGIETFKIGRNDLSDYYCKTRGRLTLR